MSLLLVHGAGSGPWVYDGWAESFSGITVAAVDLQESLEVAAASHADYARKVAQAAAALPAPVSLCGYARAAGVTERRHVTPHTLRHVFASELLRAGANLRQIQELLGHKHLDATQRDTRVTAHELRGAVKRLQFRHAALRDRTPVARS
jgi:hypothetical protein